MEAMPVQQKPALPAPSASAAPAPRTKKVPAKAKPAKAAKKQSHAERVELVLTELNDLLDEHEAELKEVKDRVQAALSRTSAFRKAVKAAVKDVSVNFELEAELADYRKKFESVRNLVG
ncbi:MAG: hypothetical protein AAFQ82_00145 [Myxococcota bacterium]